MSEHDPIDWDELDAETQHELVSLADKLGEESGESGGRTASRREFLGAVTAAGLGGSLLSQGADRAFEDFVNPASAGTQSVAQFGEAGEPFDFVAEDIYGPGGKGSGDVVNFESVNTDSELNKQYILQTSDSGLTVYDPADYANGGAALQQALDDLPASGGDVMLPRAELTVSSTVTVPTGTGTVVRLIGRGDPGQSLSAGSVLNSTISDGSDVLDMTSTVSEPARGNILRDFAIDGSGSDGAGIKASYWYHNGYAHGLGVYGVGGRGFDIDESFTQSLSRLRARNTGGAGMHINHSNGTQIRNSHFQDCGGEAGLYVLNQTSGSVQGCSVEGNDLRGMYIRGGWSIGLKHNYVEFNGNHQVQIGSSTERSFSKSVALTNNWIKRADSSGQQILRVGDSDLLRVEDNKFTNSGGDTGLAAIQLAGASVKTRLIENTYEIGTDAELDAISGSTYVKNPFSYTTA